MANRHAHKKLRAEIRSRMARTGESYQKARSRILEHTNRAPRIGANELVAFTYFGLPATLAIVERNGHVFQLVVPSTGRWKHDYPDPLRLSRAWATGRVRGVQ